MKKAIVPLGIILLVIFGVFMYLNRFTLFHVSDVDGYVFNTNNIATNLAAGLTENSEKITFEKVKVNDSIYQSGKKYYIGEETKINVNLDYPIVSQDSSSVYVLNNTGKYIDENFIKETTFENSIFTQGYMYNGNNNEQLSEDKYTFIELNNGIFMNLVEINVRKGGKDHVIPVNSFIYFEQSFLRYYELINGQYEFKTIANISDSTKTLVGDDEYKYYDLLIFLEVLSKKEDKIEIIEEIQEQETEEKPQTVITPSQTTPNQGLVGGETPSGGHVVEEEYVKPVVTLKNIGAGVYSLHGELNIYDPTSRIYKTPTLEYKYKGQVYLRNSFNKSGTIETIGLMPSTVYEVTGYYYYHDEFNNKMKNTFFEQEIVTDDISKLETINMSIGNIAPDIKSVEIQGIKLKNGAKDEVLKGLKNGIVYIGGNKVVLNSGDINDLVALDKVDFKTDKILKSNTQYSGYIQLIDIAGNVTGDIIKITGNTFNFTTLKSPPTAETTVGLTKNFTQADMKVKVSNPDGMTDTAYRYYVYDRDGNLLNATDHNGQGTLVEGNNSVILKNLYAEELYTVKVYADYRSVTGEMVYDYEMDSYEFITYDVSRLGTINFTVNVKTVTQQGAVIQFYYANYKEDNPVFELMDPNVRLIIYDTTNTNIDEETGYPVGTYFQNINKDSLQNPVEISLNSSTNFDIQTDRIYRIEMIPTITSGGKTYNISSSLSTKEFQTLKDDAIVEIKNGFVASGYLDFDVCVSDKDGAIKGNDVLVKLVDSKGNINYTKRISKQLSCAMNSTEIDGTDGEGENGGEAGENSGGSEGTEDGETQTETQRPTDAVAEGYTRIIVDGLEADTYAIQVEAPEYNIGSSNITLQSNYKIDEEKIAVSGTTGDMTMNGLINMVNHKITQYLGGVSTGEQVTFDDLDDVNLFDISNNTRWKTVGHANTTNLKEIRIEDNEISLSAYKGWRQYSYYLPELKNSAYIISFDYEYNVGTEGTSQKICMSFDDDSGLCHKNITQDLVDGGGSRLSYMIYPAAAEEAGYSIGEYITFYIWEHESKALKTELVLKDVKVELIQSTSDTASDYTAFGSKGDTPYTTAYAGDFTASFKDIITTYRTVNASKELYFNRQNQYEYLVRYFVNGKEQNEMEHKIEYNTVDEATNQPVTAISENYVISNIQADADFEARLSIRTTTTEGVRYYDLKVVEFSSEAETRTISTVDEFLNMHMYGYYLVTKDLDFSGRSGGYGSTFQGSVDFQGHKVTISQKTGMNSLMSTIGGGGVVKNLDLHFLLNQDTIDTYFYGLVTYNYGLINNVRISVDSSVEPERTRTYTVEECENQMIDGVETEVCKDVEYSYTEKTGHEWFTLMGHENYGTVDNFIIDLKAPVYCKEDCSLGFLTNAGTIKNGYIIGENIKAGYTADGNNKDVGVLARSASTNSKMENIYSLIDVELSSYINPSDTGDYTVANLVTYATSAEITNIIIVDPRIVYQDDSYYGYNTTYRNYSKDVAIYSNSGSMIEDLYYIGNFNYSGAYAQEAVISHLSNESFMSARLNSEKKFNTVEAWQASVFPTLIWDNFMPVQERINIPKKNELAYLKILSVDSVIQDKNHKDFKDAYKEKYFARVQLSIYNPKNLKVAGFRITDVGDSSEAFNIVVDSQTAGNSDKIGILTIYIKEPSIFKTKYKVTDIFVNNQNGSNTISGLTKSCGNGLITTELDCNNFPTLSLDLYKYVSNIKEIEAAQNAGHKNFRLSNDIDLKGVTGIRLAAITGVLDGDGHSINNIETDACFIASLSGTVKNLNVNNLDITLSSNSDYKLYGSFICTSTTGAIIDNVHLKDVDVTAGGASTLYLSGLVAKSANTKIRNSSVTNFEIKHIKEMKGKTAYAGGMIAHSTSTNITNSFVRKLNLKLTAYVAGDEPTQEVLGVSEYEATGGLIGYMAHGNIENVYATGTIDTQFGNVGGIIGVTPDGAGGYIRSAITKVNIYTIGDYVGGIAGKTDANNTNSISKTLVMGDILTSSDSASNYDRTSGTQITPNQNFAWNRQSINSVVTANTKMEELLDDEELANSVIYNAKIGLSEFDFAVSVNDYAKRYDENGNLADEFIMVEDDNKNIVQQKLQYGIIPKILNTSTGKLLPNQDATLEIGKDADWETNPDSNSEDTVIHYVELFSVVGEPEITYYSTEGTKTDFSDDVAKTDPWYGEYVLVKFQLQNVNKYEINSINLEDLRIVAGSSPSYTYGSDRSLYTVQLRVEALPNKNYDSYKITGVNYINSKGELDVYRAVIKLSIPFYGRIETASDWQSIKTGTYQNFALANDVDLSAYQNNTANINVSFNKLIGIDQKIKDADGNVTGTRAPIISGITRTNLTNNVGAIDTVVSEIRNVSFKNITLVAKKNQSGNYFGVIKNLTGKMLGSLNQSTGTYQRMKFDNIYLDGQSISYVGIIAYNKSPDIHYIEYNNVNVKGNQYVGGFIGRTNSVDKTDIIGSNIYAYAAYRYVGGLIGYESYNWSRTFTFNVTLNGVYVYSKSDFAGGAYGYGAGRNVAVHGTTNEIKLETAISSTTYDASKFNYILYKGLDEYNVVASSTHYVGGVAGQFSSCYPYYNYAYDLNIYGDHYIGGVCGYRWNCHNAAAINCDITGRYYVGGISGWAGYTVRYATVAGGSVQGIGNVGGICGGISSGAIYDCHVGTYFGRITEVKGREDTTTTTSNIGGLVGYVNTGYNYIYYNEVTAIVSGDWKVGGLIGLMENRNESSSSSKHWVRWNIVANTTVNANSTTRAYAGGLIGRVERNFPYNYLYSNILSVTVNTKESATHKGYIIGGSEYKYSYNIKDKEGNIIETITVDFYEENGDKFIYQLSDDGTTKKSYATNIKVYEESTLNNVPFKEYFASIDPSPTGTGYESITYDRLASWDLYRTVDRNRVLRTSVDASATTGLQYYPYTRYADFAVNYPNSMTLNLPKVGGTGYTTSSAPMYHILPDFQVYAVDVDKINIEFEEVDPYSVLTVNNLEYQVNQNVFTFYYDFVEDFEVKISDSYNEKTVAISAEDIKNGVTVVGEYFYYLKDGEVITNKDTTKEQEESDETTSEETQTETDNKEEETTTPDGWSNTDLVAQALNNLTTLSVGGTAGLQRSLAASDTEDNTQTLVGNATNIYGNEVLLENKNIYNIETGEIYENDFNNLTLAETESLYEYDYAGQKIETFYFYSLIDGKRVDKQVFVKNGQIEIVATEIDNKKNKILVDNYNDQNYLIYLGSDGKLYSLKDDIVFPKGFKNINIRSISTNANTNTDMLFVEYNDGSYTVFNYRTGQLIIKQSEENISLEDYIKQYLELSYDNVSKTNNPSYEKAKKLVEKLNTRPVSSFHNGESTTGNGTLTSSKYSIVYNPSTQKYEVYEFPGENDSSINSLTKSLDKSVDDIIDEDPLMIEYYRETEGSRVTIISAILIVIGIILGITGAVLILGRNVKKEKKIYEKRKEAKA